LPWRIQAPAHDLSAIAAVRAHSASSTLITIDGAHPGPVFDGVGAIGGGGGNSRFLIDYPPTQQSQILNYLFSPGGADLQMLKLEIGGDGNSSDGSEPSIEHSRGQIDCKSGYEWWLAEQAVALDPSIKLYALQWTAPGWVGWIWSHADANYVIQWLNCAKQHHLTISYLGGWDERTFNIGWFEYLRSKLDASGYRSVKIIAADMIAIDGVVPTTWGIANAMLAHPALRAAIGILGGHDTCGYPTKGYHCEITPQARQLGVPLWESELGGNDGDPGAAPLARAINNGYIQAGMTGYLAWPLVDSMPPGLLWEKRGLVIADQPQTGNYVVNRITWAIAQTTQFVKPGWRHVYGANAELGNSGSYNSYESPNGSDWSLVVENTGHSPDQQISPQNIQVRLTGGLATKKTVHVWATNLSSNDPATWFVQQANIQPVNGAFSYSILPGYEVSFTSTSGQSHYQAPTPPLPAPMTLPYQATPDLSNEAWGMASQEGAFIYRPCLGGVSGQCIEQMAGQLPNLWQRKGYGTPTPLAIMGDPSWANYTVATNVLFTSPTGTVNLLGRFGSTAGDKTLLTGYELSLNVDGNWQITRHSRVLVPVVIARGHVAALKPGTWHALSFSLVDSVITASLDGTQFGYVVDHTYTSGLAGIGSSWNLTQFNALTVSSAILSRPARFF
jgi:hypothetical protein